MSEINSEYGPETYGDRLADTFDEFYGDGPPMEYGLPLLPRLAGKGPALELGIGTGRVALPIQRLGVEVHGIDASQRMFDKLREKQGGVSIPVTIGGSVRTQGTGRIASSETSRGAALVLPTLSV